MENAQQCSNVTATPGETNPTLKDAATPSQSTSEAKAKGEVEVEVEAGAGAGSDSTPSTLDLLSNLHLRKIIKENHGGAINGLMLQQFDTNNAHLVVTCGKDQVNVYDNAHCGNHLDLCCHFVNAKTEYSQGGDVSTAIWLKGVTGENEAWIAFSSKGGEIGVISIANVRVARLLKGHKGEVIDMCTHPQESCDFYSLGTDGNVCRWTAESDAPVSVHVGNGSYCLCAYEDRLLVGFKTGKIEAVSFSDKSTKVLMPPTKGSKVISMKFVDSNQCITFSDRGVLQLINLENGEAIRTMKLGGFSRSSTIERASFDITRCGGFVCAGNPEGEVYIFNLASGKRINVLSMPRIRAAVSACSFAPENRSVLVSTIDGILWRWDFFIAPEDA